MTTQSKAPVEDRIAEIRERLANSTPGEWEAIEEPAPDTDNFARSIYAPKGDHKALLIGRCDQSFAKRDGEFIRYAKSDIDFLLTELTASQLRERALTEERDGLRKQVYDLTGIVSDKNDKIAGLTSENKRLKDALGKIRAAAAPMGYDAGDSHIHEIALAALQQSQGGGE